MWTVVFRYIAAFEGGTCLLSDACSNPRSIANVPSLCHVLRENIMDIDVASMEVWKN
jgi:hypothetical protein